MIGLAGADGIAEFRDPRAPDKSPIARLDISQMLFERGEVASRSEAGEVTALEFRMDGLHLGIGKKRKKLLELFFFFHFLVLH